MITRRFVCKRCGNKFEWKVFEPGEAESEGKPTQPLRCPECRGPVEKVS